MKKATKAGLEPILCDLGGTFIRFCVEPHHGALLQPTPPFVERMEVHRFRSERRPFDIALAAFCEKYAIDTRGRELRLSLPGEITGRAHSFPNLSRAWDLDEARLEHEHGFTRVWARNDAVAAFYGLFPLYSDRANPLAFADVVREGQPDETGRIVLMTPGTGLGVAAAYREQLPDGPFWLPIPSEFGAIPAGWTGRVAALVGQLQSNADDNKWHDAVLSQLHLINTSYSPSRYEAREYIVSGPGLQRLFYAVRGTKLATSRAVGGPDPIIQAAEGSGKDAGSAKEALQLFCELYGQAAADLAVTFTARVGIHLAGSLSNAITAEGLRRHGFVKAFESRLEALGFSADIPVLLVKHPYPELVGLSRFKDNWG